MDSKMIKEIFEIEPKQKNVLIIIVGIFGLSFLQLYLFKPSVFDFGILFTVGVALGLTVCWIILNIFPIFILHGIFTHDSPKSKPSPFESNLAIFLLGIIDLSCISSLTFVAYIFEFTFKKLLLISVTLSFIFTLILAAMRFLQYRKTKKQKQHTSL